MDERVRGYKWKDKQIFPWIRLRRYHIFWALVIEPQILPPEAKKLGSSRGHKHARARVGRTEVSPRRERQTTVEGRGCSLTLPLSPPTHSPTHCQPHARQSTPSPPDHVTCIPSKTESLGWKMEKFASRWCCTCMLHGRDVHYIEERCDHEPSSSTSTWKRPFFGDVLWRQPRLQR